MRGIIKSLVYKLVFPKGAPKDIDNTKLRNCSEYYCVNAYSDIFFYNVKTKIKRDDIKAIVDSIEGKAKKIKALKEIISFLSIDVGSTDSRRWQGGSWFELENYRTDNRRVYLVLDDSKLSFKDLIFIMGNEKIPKSLFRSILYNISFSDDDRPAVMELIRQDRIDIFRILNERVGLEFSKEELLEIIDLPKFSEKSSTGLISSLDTVDIVNRRAMILYQKNTDEEVIMKLLNTIVTTKDKEKLLLSLNNKNVRDKYMSFPTVQLLLKLA